MLFLDFLECAHSIEVRIKTSGGTGVKADVAVKVQVDIARFGRLDFL